MWICMYLVFQKHNIGINLFRLIFRTISCYAKFCGDALTGFGNRNVTSRQTEKRITIMKLLNKIIRRTFIT